MISWELRQDNKRVQNSAPGTKRHDVKPLHIQPDAWNALYDWWDSAKFRAMSDQNKDNRKRKILLHTTGAKPYVIFRQELEKKERRMLTLVEFFDATHEKKNQKGTFWTPEAANRMWALLVKGWDEYRLNHGISEANTPTASPPMSPNKRIPPEAEVACSLSKELGTQAHKKNRLSMGGRANLSDIYSGDEVLVQQNSRSTPTHGARLSTELLQRAIGTATIIVHAYDNEDSVARIEIEDHIQRLATEVIPKDDMFWGEYTRVAFTMVATIFAEYNKAITEDSHDDDNPCISDDDLLG
ncbi:hypothetical protein POM88_029293 [Heracleum sosnowskyi]|uniref:Uncharacterized protein n=1 Tax=Heracleum sosnowskyi TaxID=360622 RepID=A0AAD8HTM1_9APIA|nr:hypothetical protein POM88_029293 [Heracleum sosnowskyi]